MGTTKRAIAEDVWRLLMGYTSDKFMTEKFNAGGHLAILRELGLSPGHLKALASLNPDQPQPMRAMADSLACDASMVTWLVDRLEERGMVERRTLPTDRRVKTLILTPFGIETRRRLGEAMARPPEDLLTLDTSTLEVIRDALRKLPAPSRPLWSSDAAGDGTPPRAAAGGFSPLPR